MKALAIIAIGLACAGCANAYQRASGDQGASADQRSSADQGARRRNAAEMAQLIAEDDAYCKRYVDKGYDECRNNLTLMRAANGIGAQQGGGSETCDDDKMHPHDDRCNL